MVSIYGRMMNLVFRCMPQDKPGQPHDYAAERRRNDRKPPRPPKGVAVEHITLAGLPAEIIQKAGNANGTVFYIHGGGCTVGSARERRAVCQYIAAHFEYNCVSINYRLAPENLWPAQLEDCLTAYREFLDSGADPKTVVVMGESAGGMLALSLSLLLKEKGLPQPKALAAFSPCVTLAEVLPSHRANIKTDYMLRSSVAEGKLRVVFGGIETEALLRNPLVSPLYGDYTDLLPVFLSVSDTEVLLDDARRLYDKLSADGHPARLDIRHGVCHAFQVFPAMPEARESLRQAFAYLEGIG